jgi:hypothetical protein
LASFECLRIFWKYFLLSRRNNWWALKVESAVSNALARLIIILHFNVSYSSLELIFILFSLLIFFSNELD